MSKPLTLSFNQCYNVSNHIGILTMVRKDEEGKVNGISE